MKHKNNVIFKQRIQRIVFWPQTIIILLFATFIIAVDIVLIVSALETYTEHFETVLLLIFLISLLFCSPVFIVLDNFEWFEIYEDRIICRCIYGYKNFVLFENVTSIIEKDLFIYKDSKKAYYIFEDGRKTNNNIIGYTTYYNKRKYSFRIYKTEELDAFLRKKFSDEYFIKA